jgi:hypothetical protein
MKNIYNLDFLVNVCLSDKIFYLECKTEKRKESCIKEGRIVLDDVAYYKPYVKLFFSGNVMAIKYFENYDEATKWADDMKSYIKNKLEIE